jgi:Cu2+-containing amine oxidase
MEAGWYRYVSRWRLHANGTIRPRFGFSAIQNPCVCNVHYHHVYWRLDFDIRTPGNNVVREFNDPCLPGICPSNWHEKAFEIKRPRDPAHHRKWRVENTKTGEAYDIIPSAQDNLASAMPDAPFGRGDVWVLRYRATEIEDGVGHLGHPCEAGIDGFVGGESVKDTDVVIWYGAHFTHDVAAEPPGVFGDVVGPDLVPVKW